MWSSDEEDQEQEQGQVQSDYVQGHNADVNKPYKPLFIVIVDLIFAITYTFEVLWFYQSFISPSTKSI